MSGADPRRHRDLLLLEARALIDAGRLSQAQHLCDRLTADQPSDPAVEHLIGLIHFHRGQIDEAIARLGPIATAETGSAAVHSDLGACYFAAGRENEARAAFRRAVAADDAYPAAHFNLGNLYAIDSAHEEAEKAFRRAATLQPSSFDALYNLALVLIELGRFDEAVAAVDKAIEIEPHLADCHCARGVALETGGDHAEAALAYRMALECDAHHAAAAANLTRLDSALPIDPEDASSRPPDLRRALDAVRVDPRSRARHVTLGRILLRHGKPMDAARVFRRAADIDPQSTDALLGLGEALDFLGNPDGAHALYGRVAELAPGSGAPWHNRAMICFRQGDYDDGFRHLGTALQLEPDNPEFRFAQGSNRLRLGHFEDGLEDYEWQRKTKRKRVEVKDTDPPFWDGSPMPGGHLLVEAEWGLGDIIMFSRFVPLLGDRVGRLTYQVYPSLLSLLRDIPGVDHVIAEGDARPAADARVRLMSLPFLLGTTLDTIPTDLDYLAVDATRVAAFRRDLSRLPGHKVGLCWRGRVDFVSELDAIQRSLRLDFFADIVRNPAMAPVSLVKSEPGDEVSTSGLAPYFVDFGRPLDDGEDAFIDTAALIKSLDLVISCDTSTAHLAATLGCPVWLLLPLGAEWRWFVDRNDSPWYPGMRLFRQKEQNIWSDVIVEVEQALEQYIMDRR